jgi:type I restriction enzyme R subunit
VDPRVPLVKLFDVEFEQVLATQTNDRAKASEVEQAIKAHLKVKMDDDPEYYQSLAVRLEEIIQKCQQKWEELVEQLLLFRNGMDEEKIEKLLKLELNETEFAFYGVLIAEITNTSDDETMDEETHQKVLDLTKQLVTEFQEAAQIVGFFQKDDEIRSIAKKIKRALLDQGFDDPELVKAVKGRFMDLGERHFK